MFFSHFETFTRVLLSTEFSKIKNSMKVKVSDSLDNVQNENVVTHLVSANRQTH